MSIVGLPVVLGLVWLGGWWLVALATLAALFALHELYWVARSLRPLVLAGYAGAVATLLGAKLGGPAWPVAASCSHLRWPSCSRASRAPAKQ